jgi:molecular chaperone DnaJ
VVVHVSFPEAVFGAEVAVPTLDGGPVTVRVPAGTRSGQTLRVRRRGVPDGRGAGDLLVTVEVHIPSDPTEAERAAIEALAEATDGSLRDGLSD